ncbi:MAG: hypothetical protein R2746_08955 [Acidimicrobiales bacterium]
MPEAALPDADRAGGRPRLVRAAIGAALLLLVAAPIVSAGWSRERQRWYPEGDDATIVLLSRDTFSSHPPLLGMISTGGASLDDPELHHPGPLELYLLSPFAHVGRQPVPGVTVAAVAVGVVALGALGWALLRLGGPGLAGAGLVAAGLVLWGLGGDVPASVWNPFVVAVPFAAFLALAVAAAGRRPGLLPWMLAAASFVMQTHLSYVGQVGLVSAWVLAVVAWRLRRDPELGPDRARLAAWSVGVVAVLWAPPLWQQATGSPGNLGQILRSATGPGARWRARAALGELGRVVGVPVLGLRPRPDIVRVLPDLDVWSAAALALPWVALLGLAWWAHRRGDRTAVRALATLGVVLLGAAITATRIPLSDGVLYQYYALWMWPVGAHVGAARLGGGPGARRWPGRVGPSADSPGAGPGRRGGGGAARGGGERPPPPRRLGALGRLSPHRRPGGGSGGGGPARLRPGHRPVPGWHRLPVHGIGAGARRRGCWPPGARRSGGAHGGVPLDRAPPCRRGRPGGRRAVGRERGRSRGPPRRCPSARGGPHPHRRRAAGLRA